MIVMSLFVCAELKGYLLTYYSSLHLLPARRYASAGNRDRNVYVSVRLSVCPSVTRRYCVKTKKASGMISSFLLDWNLL